MLTSNFKDELYSFFTYLSCGLMSVVKKRRSSRTHGKSYGTNAAWPTERKIFKHSCLAKTTGSWAKSQDESFLSLTCMCVCLGAYKMCFKNKL